MIVLGLKAAGSHSRTSVRAQAGTEIFITLPSFQFCMLYFWSRLPCISKSPGAACRLSGYSPQRAACLGCESPAVQRAGQKFCILAAKTGQTEHTCSLPYSLRDLNPTLLESQGPTNENFQFCVAVSVLSPEGKPRIKQNSPCPVDQGLGSGY